jgi:hypothetical protein
MTPLGVSALSTSVVRSARSPRCSKARIVTAPTAGETNGLPRLTIAFVDGESLTHVSRVLAGLGIVSSL